MGQVRAAADRSEERDWGNGEVAIAWRRFAIIVAAPVLAAASLEIFLSHRHDYAGHFLAGYGGTLGALMVVGRLRFRGLDQASSTGLVVGLCLTCIMLGAVLEATAFRLAKWDEVDFCNQSLGAILAALGSLAYVPPATTSTREYDVGLITGIAFLGTGACFAVA